MMTYHPKTSLKLPRINLGQAGNHNIEWFELWKAAEFKTIRKELGYTQEGLAELLGYTSRMVINWERGDNDVRKVFSLCLRLMDKNGDN